MPAKRFNITGLCDPAKHYMVDTSAKIDQIIREHIEPGDYFVINRARQYGKTTTLALLERRLEDLYLVIRISFERFGSKVFQNESFFIHTFIKTCTRVDSAEDI